jgi:uncharacterized membrane protein YgaE (UPF0421/DUF939 family)
MSKLSNTTSVFRRALLRLPAQLRPILQAAVGAVAAWYLARLLVAEQRPVFASIAAVIALGATYGQRRERAVELTGGVVVGVALADLLAREVGGGPTQLGVLVALAMASAVVLGGGPLLVTEAAVSALLLTSLDSSSGQLWLTRPVEALVGVGVALAINALVLPPDPTLQVGRAANRVFAALGATLQAVSAGLAAGDRERAEAALRSAREIDAAVGELADALEVGRETASQAPLRRPTGVEVDRYGRMARQLDYAVRNTRVLARHALRFLRNPGSAPPELAEAVADLARAVWALAAQLDAREHRVELRLHVARAVQRAGTASERNPDLALAEVVGQVRSTGVDLLRASEAAEASVDELVERSTEELLAALPDPQPSLAATGSQ